MHTENYDPLKNFIRDLSKASTDGYKDLVLFLQITIMVYTHTCTHTHIHTKPRNKSPIIRIKLWFTNMLENLEAIKKYDKKDIMTYKMFILNERIDPTFVTQNT